nr:LacI family DNA-binding transcriptional regulator [Microbacterium invictum]
MVEPTPTGGTGRKVTAKDVAAAAGVTVGTVSKALSGNGSVNEATRRRIIERAQELGYEGRSPRQQKASARMIGLITSDQFGRLTVPVVLGAIDTLAEHEIALIVCDGRGDAIREQHFIDSLLRRDVDGILVTGTGISARNSIGRQPVPVIYALAWSRSADDVSIIPDDTGGVAAATRHLLATDRRRLAFVSGPSNVDDSTAARLSAISSELAVHGLELAHEPLFGEWTESWGRLAATQLLASGHDVDGIICGNDQLARGVVEALTERGRAVPRDVAVVGLDNWDVMVEATNPHLSTVDLNLTDVGHAAANELLRAVTEGRGPGGIRRVPTRFIPRASSAAR